MPAKFESEAQNQYINQSSKQPIKQFHHQFATAINSSTIKTATSTTATTIPT